MDVVNKDDVSVSLEKISDEKFYLGIHKETPLYEIEKNVILYSLSLHGGNKTHTARDLDISIRTLQRKLKSYSVVWGGFKLKGNKNEKQMD